ncbi:hypothetical protein Tco_1016808 [Tanacetum coccineum]|uniref:Uncharacterized protein n=1 Tax=Tanacetum coccineum TaxID=301880 RepID=A0ABQ5FR27_9ASTR
MNSTRTQLLLLEYQSKTNFTLQSLVQLLRENTDSVRSNQQMRLTTPSVPLKLKAYKALFEFYGHKTSALPACWLHLSRGTQTPSHPLKNLAFPCIAGLNVLGYEDLTGAVADINEDGFLTPSDIQHCAATPKSSPHPLTSPLPASTQPSKHSSPLTINLDPIELIFLTPPTSPHTFFDSLPDLPPRTINPPLPRPSCESIKRLANQPPPLLAMEPLLPPLPPHLLPLRPNNTFPMLTNEMWGVTMRCYGLSWKLWKWWQDYKRGDVEVFVAAAAIGIGHELDLYVRLIKVTSPPNRISSDPDRTWVDEILRFMKPVGYGPTTLLLRYSDRKESLFINL